MKFINFKNILLLSIVLLAIFLRFYRLSEIPNGFYIDEAAIGYNSYSILTTSGDEYGKRLPVFLRSYGAYSSPLYTYLTAVPIKLFGLNVFSVRFLSALSGTLSVILFYLMIKKLKIFRSETIIFFGVFFFAIIPWNIFFSRGAFEANLGFFILLLSLYLHENSDGNFLKIIISVILLSLSTYAYQSNRLIALLILPLYLINTNEKLDKLRINSKILFIISVFVLIQLPQLLLATKPAFRLRAAGLFYGETIETQADKIQLLPREIALLLSFAREFSSQLTAYISPRNLFWLGDSDPQRSLPDLSVFYTWMVIPYLIGLVSLLLNLKKTQYQKFLIISLIFIIPAALTKDPFSTLRSLPFSFSILVIILLGIEKILKFKYKLITVLFLSIVIPLSFLQLWRSYSVLLPHERAKDWGYGFRSLSEIIKSKPDMNFLIDQSRMNPAYIQYLFFTGYEPVKFQSKFSENLRKNYYEDLSLNLDYEIENVRFGVINWDNDIYKDQIIFGDEYSISDKQADEHKLVKVYEIKDPIDRVVLIGYQTNPELKCKSIYLKNDKCSKFK